MSLLEMADSYSILCKDPSRRTFPAAARATVVGCGWGPQTRRVAGFRSAKDAAERRDAGRLGTRAATCSEGVLSQT